jgi:hypothetical protein
MREPCGNWKVYRWPVKQTAERRLQAVILSEALDRPVQGEAKNLGCCKIRQLQGSFLRSTQDCLRLLRMTIPKGFSAGCKDGLYEKEKP